jgi:hypothetical protein
MRWIIYSMLLVYGTAFAGSENTLSGVWRVKSILDTSPSVSLTMKEAKQLVGKRLTVNDKEIKVSNFICKEPKLTVPEEKTFEFFYGIKGCRTDPVNLKLPEKITIINVDCVDPFDISAFFLSGKNRIVFEDGGFFFDAVRVKINIQCHP